MRNTLPLRSPFFAFALVTFLTIQGFAGAKTLVQELKPAVPKDRQTPRANNAQNPLTTKEVYQRLLAGTVWVRNGNSAHGTGWIYDKKKKLIITNHHVVKGAEQITIFFPKFKEGSLVTDAEEYVKYTRPVFAKIIDSDVGKDLALLQVNAEIPGTSRQLDLAERSTTAAERVHICGGMPQSSTGVFVYANGHVRQISRGVNSAGSKIWLIQTTVPSNPGNSGGAIVDDQAKVVGVHSMGWTKSRNVTGGTELKELKNYLADVEKLYPPTSADDHFKAGWRHFRAARYLSSTHYFSRAIQLEPEKGEAYRLRGYCFKARNDLESAMQDFDKAIEIHAGDWDAYRGRALTHEFAGRLDQAMTDISEAIRLNPNSTEAYYNRGSIRIKNKSFENAVKDFDRSISLNRNFYPAIHNRGYAYMTLGLYEKALADFNLSLKLNPTVTGYNNIGVVLWQLGNKERAVDYYSYATKVQPNYYLPWENLGEVNFVEGKLDTAISYLNHSLKLNPRSSRSLGYRGKAKFLVGQRQAGLADIQAAIQLNQQDANLYFARASMLREMGNSKEAENDFALATKLDPKRYPPQSHDRYTTAKPAIQATAQRTVLDSRHFNGTWKFRNVISGVRYDATITFSGDRFHYVISWVDAAGRPGRIDKQGNYSIGQNALRMKRRGGQPEDYGFSFRDGYLFIDFPDANEFFGFERLR